MFIQEKIKPLKNLNEDEIFYIPNCVFVLFVKMVDYNNALI